MKSLGINVHSQAGVWCLVDEDGELRYFVNIFINGEDVRFLQGLNSSTKSGDEVSIVPAVAGGLCRSYSSVA